MDNSSARSAARDRARGDPWYWTRGLRAHAHAGVCPRKAEGRPRGAGIVDGRARGHPDVECLVQSEGRPAADMPEVRSDTDELLRLLVRHELSRRRAGAFLHGIPLACPGKRSARSSPRSRLMRADRASRPTGGRRRSACVRCSPYRQPPTWRE